jgi:hypothetical protein
MREILSNMPWWYFLALILFSLYYGVRGVMEQIAKQRKREGEHTKAGRIVVVYAQEFLFKFIFTVSAFFALSVAHYIFLSLKSLNDISAGTAVLLVFLFVWGVTGVSGYLTFLIVSGRFPGFKGSD